MPFVTKARKKNDPALRDPSAGLNKAEREIYDIYIRALGQMRNDLNDPNVIRAVREAVEAGMPYDGGIAFKWQEFIASLQRSIPQLASQVANSANVSAKALPKKISIQSNFGASDPRAIAWAQQRAGARISGIVQESQRAVAEIIANGLRTKLSREQVIRQITEIVGLDTRQGRALANFYEKNLLRLIEDGMDFEKAEREALKLSKEYRQRLLVQRATRIARTETLAAANAGRMLSWQEANAQGLLPPGSVKRWKTATDERTCPTCAPLHNKDVPWDTVFPTGDMMPPVHPNCRCTAVIIPGEPVFAQNVEKRYYRFADGEETWRNYDYRWRKIATELKRKVGKCQRCGSKSDLTVDHKKRLKDGGAKYDRKNLRVLCRSCNGKLARLGTKLRKSNNSWLFAKHLQGQHDQKTHGRGGGWSKGEWKELSDTEYISYYRKTLRAFEEKRRGKPYTDAEWAQEWQGSEESILGSKPQRVYQNGQIVLYSERDKYAEPSKYQTQIYEEALMREIDELQELYPLDELIVRVGNETTVMAGGDAVGVTLRGLEAGPQMWIRGDALNPMSKAENLMPGSQYMGVREYVLTHEWGHTLDKSDSPGNWESKDSRISGLLSATYPDSTGKPVSGISLMSQYGNSAPHEAFAEAFVDYVAHQKAGKANELSPLVSAMATEFGWDKPWKR